MIQLFTMPTRITVCPTAATYVEYEAACADAASAYTR